jgi:6-pyruvoyltetrahydropterin/6-carboxytetrahydropterin synthase
MGWVMDFAEIEAAFEQIEDQVDHRCLNEIGGLTDPTSENLARWLWMKLLPLLPAPSQIVVAET